MEAAEEQTPESTTPPGPPPTKARRALPTGFDTLRDVVVFILGFGIVGNEVFLQPQIEEAAMTVGIALLGLPIVFGTTEKKK